MSKANGYTVGSIAFAVCMLAFFVAAVVIAAGYPESASLAPVMVGVLGIAATIFQVGIEFIENRRARTPAASADASSAPDETPRSDTQRREIELGCYFVALIAAVLLLGFWIATPVFIAVFLRARERIAWPGCLLSAVAAELVIYLMFWKLLQIPLFSGFALQWLNG